MVRALPLFLAWFVVLINADVKYDLSLVSHACLENKAIEADYTPHGQIISIGNLPVYEYEPPGNVNRNRMLIAVYDIYGFTYSNLMQVTDQISLQSGGFRAILPDFFRGEVNSAERGDWNTVIKPDLLNILQHYQNEGVEYFAIFGFCWGGKQATNAAIELSEYFKAGAMVHPSSVTNAEAEDVQIPMYLMPSQSEPDMLPFYEVLQTKFGDNCGHRRFDDMNHGFAGARGNFSDPLIRERVDEVISTLGAFFDRNLRATTTTTTSTSTTTTTEPNNVDGIASNIYPGYLLIITLITSVCVILRS